MAAYRGFVLPLRTIEVTIENIKKNITRKNISFRGGGIELDLSEFGFQGETLTVYQEYLGSGILGRVCAHNNCNQEKWNKARVIHYAKIEDQLKRYLFSLTNKSKTLVTESFEQNQRRPKTTKIKFSKGLYY